MPMTVIPSDVIAPRDARTFCAVAAVHAAVTKAAQSDTRVQGYVSNAASVLIVNPSVSAEVGDCHVGHAA